jgi:restriction system protein
MAKRSLARGLTDLLLGGLGILLILLALAILLLRSYPVPVISFAVLAFGFWSFAKWRSALARERRRMIAIGCTNRQIERHRNALVSYFRQSIRSDLFGNEDKILWRRHIDTFLESQVAPELSAQSIIMDGALGAELSSHVDDVVRKRVLDEASQQSAPQIDPATVTATGYEQHCASILSGSGWTVHATPVSGDHGADVIAEKDGQRLVVQCKLYARPVGNKAVQEVYSARPLYNCDHACVVAPLGFTAQAQRAAHSLSVRLLHHDELRMFADELVRCGGPRVE